MTDLSVYFSSLFSKALKELKLPQVKSIEFEHPTNITFGDYSSNLAMTLFSQLKDAEKPQYRSPRALAEAIAEVFERLEKKEKGWVETVSVAGPGFINLTLNNDYLYILIHYLILSTKEVIPDLGHQRTAIVEYSSPNIAKPFTVGHLRSTIIGQAVANILQATGWDVKRDNHLGDWGTQFGKQIYALIHLGEGSLEKNVAKIEASKRPVKVLVDLYVEFHQLAETHPEMEDDARAWFKRLENGDAEARKLWQMCIDWSWAEFNQIYKKLGVSFTENGGRGYGESYFEDKMEPVLQELEASPTVDYQTGKDGAKLVFFPNDELPPLMIIKKDGATLYATRDLATDRFRKEMFGQDVLIINEVGAEQELYFRQIYRIEELLGWFKPGQRVHVKHGMYRFKEGKMSTRKGNVIWLEDVLLEAEKRAVGLAKEKSVGEEIAGAVGIGALRWNDLKRSSHLDVVFDWDEILTMQGNSGPYVQYAYVRCQSILAKAREADLLENITKQIDIESYSFNTQERTLTNQLMRFGEVMTLSATEYAPHHLCNYLYSLAQAFNSFYNHHSVLGTDVSASAQQARLQLTQATANVLKSGLDILGIEAVERM